MDCTRITVTADEFKTAVANYDLIMPTEVQEVYRTMLVTKEFGARVAAALQEAMNTAKTPEQMTRVLDAVVLPAFLIGLLVGREQGSKQNKCLDGR